MFGDPVLRIKAAPVDDFDTTVSKLVDDLVETLIDAGGAGLAAPQIGIGLRAFVYVDTDPASESFRKVKHLINPVLREQDEILIEDQEGCLSIPGLTFQLARPQRIVAEGFNRHGEPVRIEGTERIARALAHETDHLDGVLFVDRLEPEERKRAMAAIREMLLAGEDVMVKQSPHGPRIPGQL
jgi:peptide deformylase